MKPKRLHIAAVIREYRANLKASFPKMSRRELDARIREARRILRAS